MLGVMCVGLEGEGMWGGGAGGEILSGEGVEGGKGEMEKGS